MNTIKNAANSASESVQGALSGASKEANKSVAKDSNASLGTRARAAGDMVSDKVDEHQHSTASTVHKEAAKH